MKRYDSDEDLERALFALDLEEPPAELRATILAGTIYRPPIAVKPWEIWMLGLFCALLAWVVALYAQGGSLPAFERISDAVSSAASMLSKPQTLLWAAVGAGTVLWISQLNLTLAPGALRTTRR